VKANINGIALADALTTTCVRVIADSCGVKVPHDVMALIIARSRVEEELLEHYGPAAESLDTVDREWLMDLVGEHYTGLPHWPLNMDTEEYSKQYYELLVKNARAQGAEILEDTP
jgi:hypothetical protein